MNEWQKNVRYLSIVKMSRGDQPGTDEGSGASLTAFTVNGNHITVVCVQPGVNILNKGHHFTRRQEQNFWVL